MAGTPGASKILGPEVAIFQWYELSGNGRRLLLSVMNTMQTKK